MKNFIYTNIGLVIIGISFIGCTNKVNNNNLKNTSMSDRYNQSENRYSANKNKHHNSKFFFQDLNSYKMNYSRSQAMNIVKFKSKKLLGKRYLWGATGPYKFDCSGFTQSIYKDIGISIPRVSRSQATVGKYITFNKLKLGDMVFFDTAKRYKGRVTHVGIYLSHGNFIHASSSKKQVTITNFHKADFYRRRFLWGRRVIHNQKKLALRTQFVHPSLQS